MLLTPVANTHTNVTLAQRTSPQMARLWMRTLEHHPTRGPQQVERFHPVDECPITHVLNSRHTAFLSPPPERARTPSPSTIRDIEEQSMSSIRQETQDREARHESRRLRAQRHEELRAARRERELRTEHVRKEKRDRIEKELDQLRDLKEEYDCKKNAALVEAARYERAWRRVADRMTELQQKKRECERAWRKRRAESE